MPKLTKESFELVRALQLGRRRRPDKFPWGGALFLIGAGCSASSGIPLAKSIAENCMPELANRYSNGKIQGASPSEALAWLKKNDHIPEHTTWDDAYNEIFQNHHSTQKEQRKVIMRALRMQERINETHQGLARLISERYVGAVLTTNFDELLRQATIGLSYYINYIEDVGNVAIAEDHPHQPSVVHLHGTTNTYKIRNTIRDLKKVATQHPLVSYIKAAFRWYDFLVVVGYSGREPGVMEVLIEATQENPDKKIFWVLYEDYIEALPAQAIQLLETCDHPSVILGQDSDELMGYILKKLDLDICFQSPVAQARVSYIPRKQQVREMDSDSARHRSYDVHSRDNDASKESFLSLIHANPQTKIKL